MKNERIIDCTDLIEKNGIRSRKVVKLNESRFARIESKAKEFDSKEMRALLSSVRQIIRVYGSGCKGIVFAFYRFNPKDKMVYILLEMLLHTLANIYHYQIQFAVKEYTLNINTDGFRSSELLYMAEKGFDLERFNKKFRLVFEQDHFRKVLGDVEDVTAPAMLVSEIKTFLFKYHMKEEFDKNLALVIGELADNALNHAKSPCLVDIDITTDYKQKDDDSGECFYSINIVVLNLSGKCLYDDIQRKMEENDVSRYQRYREVNQAYGYHKSHFGKSYNQRDFYMVTSFQDEISGRENEWNTGGRGLPELVRTLEEFAYADYCYVLSGKNVIIFEKETLNYTKDGWIGFNRQDDYRTAIPDSDVLTDSSTYLPGTGYNFMLVFHGGSTDEQGKD